MRLFDISEHIRLVYEQADQYDDGVLSERDEKWLDSLDIVLDKKALDIAALIVEENAEIDAMKKVVDNIKKRVQTSENRVSWLTNYLTTHIPEGGKHQDERVRIGWRKSKALVITDIDKVPESFTKTDITISKQLIKDAMRVKGITKNEYAVIVERNSIQIR